MTLNVVVIASSGSFGKDTAESGEEVFVIPGTLEDRASFYTSDDDMVGSDRGIESFTRHGEVSHDNGRI